MERLKCVEIRNAKPSDHSEVISVMPQWWGGRDLSASVPKVFFIHFCNTIFIAHKGNELVGFLVGFLSQTNDKEGYIHFAGVHPNIRKTGSGELYIIDFSRFVWHIPDQLFGPVHRPSINCR